MILDSTQTWLENQKYLTFLLPLVLNGCVSLNTESVALWEASETHQIDYLCHFTPAKGASASTSGLVVGAGVLLPDGYKPDYGVHIRFNGKIGAVDSFIDMQKAYSEAAILDCRGKGILSPGFINAHEHPAFSYEYPNKNLEPEYEHRDEWRCGINGKTRLPSPTPYYYKSDGKRKETAILIAMELRHLLGGATTIAGSGGVPGVIKNIQRRDPSDDLDSNIYVHEADVSTFPFPRKVISIQGRKCKVTAKDKLTLKYDKNHVYMAYVPHIGEGRARNSLAKLEVKHYLQHVKKQRKQRDKDRQNRRYSLVHGIAVQVFKDQGHNDYEKMRQLDVTLVWSPRSNLALYGETIDIERALDNKVRIALATDWSPTGSYSMKEEFKCAKKVVAKSTSKLSNQSLWRMATSDAAYALGLEDSLGAIKPGFWADMVLVKYTGNGDPYHDVFTASDEDILATWVNGKAILLSSLLDEVLSKDDCEEIQNIAPKICGLFGDFNLGTTRFTKYIEETVPLIGTHRQAPCEQ